jgi:sugar phosphate isomerase/epimerase
LKLSTSSLVYYHYTLADAIRQIAAAGYAGIDVWGGRPQAYRRDLSPQDIQELVRLLDESGMQVASFIPAQFRYPTILCCPIEKIRQDSLAFIKESIETAAALGAPLVSVCPGHTLHGQTVEDGLARLGDSLSAIAEFAARLQMRVAIEPADRYETDLLPTCLSAMRLAERLGYANLGVLLDNGHAFLVDELAAEVVAQLGHRLFHVHLDDNNGQRDQHLIPGDGRFEFAPFLAALQQAKYAGFLTVELSWDYSVDPDPAVHLSHERVTALLRDLS